MFLKLDRPCRRSDRVPAFAQTALYRLDGEHDKLVHKMDYRRAYIVNPSPDDSASGTVAPRYRLQPVEEFFPALVTVKVIQASFSRAGLERRPSP